MTFYAVDSTGKTFSDRTDFLSQNSDHFFDIRSIGTSVFESIRTYNTINIFAAKEHIQRLLCSAKILQISHSFSAQSILKVVEKVVQNSLISKKDLRINIFLTKDFFWVLSKELILPPKDFYSSGIEICDETFERPFPEAKYPNPIYSFFDKKRPANCFETIFFNKNGFLREGNISNVFAVFGDKIVTPSKGILPGITRQKVLELAEIETREISQAE
ncbi:MAG: aminotransferase class IV, partial [Candidatus Peregrinibacteria bacterium]|nr:aminotransferase class IV [Candidatus Peregrinibacteria bacterium]